MNLCWPKHQRQFHFSPARSLRFVFLFSSIEFIHEKEGKETDGSTDRREFSNTMLVSNHFEVDLWVQYNCVLVTYEKFFLSGFLHVNIEP